MSRRNLAAGSESAAERQHVVESGESSRYIAAMFSFTNRGFDPYRLAVLHYFGDLGYEKLPKMAQEALEAGHDGEALRKLAGLMNPVASDISQHLVDSAFRDMGITAPISKEEARLVLARECVQEALDGRSNVFDAAMHIKIYLCGLDEPPEFLRKIVQLSDAAERAPRCRWGHLERQLTAAMMEFLKQ